MNEKIKQMKALYEGLFATYERKNNDYGDSFDKSVNEFGLVAAVVRIGDKFNRLKSLIKGAKYADDMTDTLRALSKLPDSGKKAAEAYGYKSTFEMVADIFNSDDDTERKVSDESVKDTLLDMANYCVMTARIKDENDRESK